MKIPWTAREIPSQLGRRVVITGANSAIGFHTALELARHGAEAILPARTEAKAQDAVDRIHAEVPDAKLFAEILDLADHSSIRAFAARTIERFPGESLDQLINNAGAIIISTLSLIREIVKACTDLESEQAKSCRNPQIS